MIDGGKERIQEGTHEEESAGMKTSQTHITQQRRLSAGAVFTSSVCQSLCAGVRCYMSGSEIRAEIGPGMVRGRYL